MRTVNGKEMKQQDKPAPSRRPRHGTRRGPAPEVIIRPRRHYTGATGASIGDLPERAEFDRGSRVIK
jgi:hypothetical protein